MTRQHKHLERLTFFADAVFAIAMTLLVVEVRLPHLAVATDAALADALLALLPAYVAFLASFLVLARFWIGHHLLMGHLAGASQALVWGNLLLLLAVAFMPFPTSVLSQYAQLRTGIGVYCGWLLLIGLLNRHIIDVIARDPGLLADDADPSILRRQRTRSWIPVVIALVAFAAGMVRPLAGMAALLLVSPLATWWLDRRARRLAPA